MKLSDTDFPREVRERMEQVLLPGDEILWTGTALPGMKRNLLIVDGVNEGGVLYVFFHWLVFHDGVFRHHSIILG